MPLQPGRRLGLFEVISPLGAGGMGEVYRARDTRLGRDVALKVLPAEFATRPDRRARFEREARLLASLQHPGIAAIHGFEGADGVSFLVLELVEGRTLAQRVDRGPLPVPEALEIARQIALALEAAHEKGIIHRDLKPSNVMVMADGRVKLLDFGLAKAMEGDALGSALETESDPASQTGLVLGTAPYMSPEQARGETVDKRTDVWAFGCVLYEMLAGRRAFPGATTSDAVAAVLSRDPDWTALPAGGSQDIQRLIERCLRRDPAQRLHDVADARIEIEDARVGRALVQAPATRRPGGMFALVAAGAVGAAALIYGRAPQRREPDPRPPMHLLIRPESSAPLGVDSYLPIAVTPTNRELIYDGGASGLRVRALGEGVSRAIGQFGGSDPFVSPDGQWIAFWASARLKKAPLSGASAPRDLCAAEDLIGGAWTAAGGIIFAASLHGPLLQVSEGGGQPQALTKLAPGEIAHLWPELLPGERVLVYTARTGVGLDDFELVVEALDARGRVLTIPGASQARYSRSGHLVYARRNALYAVRFDAERLQVAGPAVKVLDDVATGPGGFAQYTLANDGTLYYLATEPPPGRRLVWVSRNGETQPLPASPRPYAKPRLSPDERQVALEIGRWPDNHLWIYDISSNSLRRLTERSATVPVWTPDGRKLAFAQSADGNPAVHSIDLFWQRADGSEPAELLLDESAGLWPIAWTGEGRTLAFVRYAPEPESSGPPAGLVDAGDRSVEAVPTGPAEVSLPRTWLARLSPDERWLASISDESGRFQLYVQPFGRHGPRSQLTTEGATQAVWSADGREIFYRNGDRMMAIPVETSPTLRSGDPRILFRGDYVPSYDVARDGRRFLMIEAAPEERETRAIHVLLGWSATLADRLHGVGSPTP